ncbi:3',5'-cyclic AMP phosphodiesterase CpdA [Saccharopolyspora erythraea NRRL 2338]|uniref:Cyclic nucleotide phosphodiesterase n=2 Tax=Saccharopolyspora erythraea TaxID=1836 RepID=A4F6Q6_SACEN|nr:phosphodiesterase [Saccharopolyspora erythraea]EQD87306.1 3',5'-cyclic-nucleotide phosphodiesterase [Saccharopolyspora erythraea D]PFG93533.1 3',5'-cyclic AMP phosphodiesterase CpdA [Saccharopolyspora erythraea NRRL 2338]QRK90388.1 phosphodiesterase [Saccharopolyspora erythraea]CAL99730.1 cyclic nucleotide phosphodiesterase [Saccharopolyspora erythraea NRRL 2338]
MTMAIAHLSDPHTTTGAQGDESVERLRRGLDCVRALDRLPDCVVITGDVADGGHRQEYEAVRAVIADFPVPVHLTTGNHDDPRGLAEVFGGTDVLGGAREARYAVDYPGFTLVALDSHMPGSPGGRLGADQLAWLDDVLARRPDVPAVVCVHHPPVAVGIPYLDGMGMEDAAEFAGVIARHRNVARVLAGHVHRAVVADFAGATLTTAPSTHIQIGFTTGEDVPPLHADPASFLLHLIDGASAVTHTLPIPPATG